jgi:hypothetical protein
MKILQSIAYISACVFFIGASYFGYIWYRQAHADRDKAIVEEYARKLALELHFTCLERTRRLDQEGKLYTPCDGSLGAGRDIVIHSKSEVADTDKQTKPPMVDTNKQKSSNETRKRVSIEYARSATFEKPGFVFGQICDAPDRIGVLGSMGFIDSCVSHFNMISAWIESQQGEIVKVRIDQKYYDAEAGAVFISCNSKKVNLQTPMKELEKCK